MYVIKMCDDKSLNVTHRARIFQDENCADDLYLLIPKTYFTVPLNECQTRIIFTLPNGTHADDVLTYEEELYKNRFIQCRYAITSDLTNVPGRLKIQLLATRSDGSIILKSGVAFIEIDNGKHHRCGSEPGCPGHDGSDPDLEEYAGYIEAIADLTAFDFPLPDAPGHPDGQPGQLIVRTEDGVKWTDFNDIPQAFMERLGIVKLAPYCYTARCDTPDYTLGAKYYERYKPALGSCSVVCKGQLVGRTYDWTYDERVSFVISTPAVNGRHRTVGVAAAPNGITKELVDSGIYSEDYKLLPFILLDGMNDAGLFCEINVVPAGDMGITTGTNHDGEDLCALMITRYVLDYASTVDEAIELLESRNIFCANSDVMKQEFHFMIADGTKAVEVEFIENEMRVIDTFVDNKAIATNYYLYGYDGTRASLTPYAMGMERSAILSAGYDGVETADEMLELMKCVWYTRTYSRDTVPFWYSEFCGDWRETGWGNLTKDSPDEDYDPLVDRYIGIFSERQRDGKTWQSVHTSVYDLSKKQIMMIPQESGAVFTFDMNTSNL